MRLNKEDVSLSRNIDILSAQHGFKKYSLDNSGLDRIRYIKKTKDYLLNHSSEVEKFWKNHESETANHWGRMSKWTRLDVTLLSLDINHQYFRSDSLGGISGIPMINPLILDQEYRERYAKILSKYYGNDIEKEFSARWQIIASKFDVRATATIDVIDWAKTTNIKFSPKLVKLVLKCNPNIVGWKEKYEQEHSLLEQEIKRGNELSQLCAELQKYTDKKIHPKEKESLLKLVAAMASGGYGHIPNKEKSPTVTTIHEDLLKNGLTLDEDTIRKYLKEAAEFIPQNSLES
jgi:hypothetical protein